MFGFSVVYWFSYSVHLGYIYYVCVGLRLACRSVGCLILSWLLLAGVGV